MKTATLLFGLATTACASGPATPQYPLCDRTGAPACGNIGQVGRAVKPTAPAMPTGASEGRIARDAAVVFASGAATAATRVVPPITRVLVGASSEAARTTPFARPLTDHREQVVCGNVMGKGGSRRVCRDAHGGSIIAETDLDENGPPTGEVSYTASH